jgi:hypothetical protein
MKIESPKLDDLNPDYAQECYLSLEPAFSQLVALAEVAGWNGDFVARALEVMASNRLRERAANELLP